MKLRIALSAIAIGTFISPTFAFDIHTHAAMSAEAMAQSKFSRSPNTSALLLQLGLRDANGVFGNRYVGFGSPLISRFATDYEGKVMESMRIPFPAFPGTQTITGWVIRGAVREDDNTFETPRINLADSDPAPVFNRVIGHFFDPISNAGLSILGRAGPTAPDWALLSTVRVPEGVTGDRENNYKISDAREAMWRALTLKKILANGTLEGITPIGGLLSYAADEAERKAYWATTFRTLGDSVHLLQDMAQPQHTRLDKHSGIACVDPSNPDAACLGGHASFFENYLKARTLTTTSFSLDETISVTLPPPPGTGLERQTTRPQLNYAGHPLPAFANYRDFFATDTGAASATGKGLANYSNRGFYSFGTNIGSGSSFAAPSPTGTGLGTELITGPDIKDMTGRPLSGGMVLRTGIVQDYATGIPTPQPVRLSAFGMWDQFLEANGGVARYTLNYYNYDAQAALLIPRAVAYSAGLIDYFFRGQLEVTPPAEGIYSLVDHFDFSGEGKAPTDTTTGFKGFKTIKLKLRNATPDIVASGGGGTFPQIMPGGTLVAVLKFFRNNNYTDDLAGEPQTDAATAQAAYLAGRSTNEEIVVSARIKDGTTGALLTGAIPVTTTAQTFVFEFDQELPINATDVQLQVVYRGLLGSEADAVVVQTVDISEPTYFTYINASDYIKLGTSVYTRSEINAGSSAGAALRGQVRPTSCIDSMTDQLKDIPDCFQPLSLTFPLRWGAGTANNASLNLPNDKTYHRFAMLLPPSASVNVNPVAPTCGANSPTPVSLRRVQTNYIPDSSPAGYSISIDIGRVAAVRAVRSFTSLACVNIGDGAPLSADDRDVKMAPLTGTNLKPLATQSFGFGAP